MKLTELLLFLLLSAIWGGSFIFMRILAPVLGPVSTTGLRLLVAGFFLVGLFRVMRHKLDFRKNAINYLIIGVVNSAIPFTLLSFAALYQSASVSAIINSMAPIWGAVFSILMLRERMTGFKALGMFLGLAGVGIIGFFGKRTNIEVSGIAVIACVLATVCYGFGGAYVKKYASSTPPKSIAAGSQFAAGILFIPYMAAVPPKGIVRPDIAVMVLVFALMCSAFAYLIYYRLIVTVGPTKSLAVTYVVPVFGFLWGGMFLGERITWPMIVGGAVICGGIFLINRTRKPRIEKAPAYAVILMHSVHHALAGERALKTSGIRCKLIPVPRELSSDCGVCLRIEAAFVTEAELCLQNSNRKFQSIVNLNAKE